MILSLTDDEHLFREAMSEGAYQSNMLIQSAMQAYQAGDTVLLGVAMKKILDCHYTQKSEVEL
jgi:hypothetical protein